ncbi:hypothetical protein, partial [Clostridium butyricum]
MKIVNLNNLELKKYGVKDPSYLTIEQTLLYDSSTLISTMDYSGPINTIITEAKGISSFFKGKLKNINSGYCSLGGQWNNANFYGPNARSLSGVDRICYVRGESADRIVVMEYYGSRGSKFSGYYKLLLSKIKASNNFKINKNNSF